MSRTGPGEGTSRRTTAFAAPARFFVALIAPAFLGAFVTTAGAQLTLLKTVTVTTAEQGGSARPEVVATADRTFVLYLGDITSGENRTFSLKLYDGSLDSVLATRVLVSRTTAYGSPTDIRVAADGQYLQVFYETHKPTSPTTAVTYLWGARYTLDDSFTRVAYTATPITSSKPMAELPEGGELLDDPAPLVGPGSVFVITRLKYSLATTAPTTYRVREFSKDSLALLSQFDLDLSAVANGRGRVTSLLRSNGVIRMALATTVSDVGLNDAVDDGAISDLALVTLREDWTLDPQDSVRIISTEPNDRENYVTGLRTDGEFFYVTYKQAVGIPPTGEQRAWIKIFDGGFRMVHQELIRTTVWGPGGGEIRPSLEVRGNRIFSGQSAGASLGSGNAQVLVYEVATTSVPGEETPRTGIALWQNRPNPFHGTTAIRFTLARRERVTLKVFDALGREVAELLDAELNPGQHTVPFSAGTLQAGGLPSGVYLYRLTAGGLAETRRMVFTR
ncbi:MAG: T9SS type A sorting domain-containing protein [Candidatus Eisenbacteria bacterium]|nr:T9SS type A sorting domain-containing protein [Candidatus Eisenbacteria bacterium]